MWTLVDRGADSIRHARRMHRDTILRTCRRCLRTIELHRWRAVVVMRSIRDCESQPHRKLRLLGRHSACLPAGRAEPSMNDESDETSRLELTADEDALLQGNADADERRADATWLPPPQPERLINLDVSRQMTVDNQISWRVGTSRSRRRAHLAAVSDGDSKGRSRETAASNPPSRGAVFALRDVRGPDCSPRSPGRHRQ